MVACGKDRLRKPLNGIPQFQVLLVKFANSFCMESTLSASE
jgi:hypothetical protein